MEKEALKEARKKQAAKRRERKLEIKRRKIALYSLELYERVQLNRYTSLVRVPGGWIYEMDPFAGVNGNEMAPAVAFIPYNLEFKYQPS